MAPLPPNSTDRYKIVYTVGGHQHSQIIRTEGIDDGDFSETMDEYYTAMSSAIYETTIDDVLFAPAGSNVFSPVSGSITGSTYGSGSPSVEGENAYFYDFVGRSPGDGRRVRFFQYGAKGLGGDYRFAPGENAALDAALAIIDSSTLGMWMAIGGNNPIWKPYIDAGVNAYWQRNLRP